MPSYSVAQAKNELSHLIVKAMNGEHVVITKRGVPVIEFVPKRTSVERCDGDPLERLRELHQYMKPSGLTSVELLNQMYEEDE